MICSTVVWWNSNILEPHLGGQDLWKQDFTSQNFVSFVTLLVVLGNSNILNHIRETEISGNKILLHKTSFFL